MTTGSAPLRFTLHGPIRLWDFAERRLNLGGRDLWLAPDVAIGDLELGTEVVARGYEGELGERWIVDVLTITSVSASQHHARALRRSRSRS